MSIYSLMAFNSAVAQAKQNDQQAMDIQTKRTELAQKQEDLDLNKKLDLAKTKQARNEGMMSDYIGNALEKHINEQYKSKQDVIDATTAIMDKGQHTAQAQANQAKQVAEHLHSQDPDVQAHVATTMSAIQNSRQAPTAASTVMPMTGNGQANNPGPQNAAIPSIFPMTSQMPSPIQQTQQIPTGQPEQAAPAAVAEQPPQEAPPAEAAPTPSAAPAQQQNTGFDLSPIEQTFGMPKGSMWINPTTLKPEMNPMVVKQIEAQQRTQANYDINQPFREEVRQDKNLKTAETYLVNALKQRGGAIGLQNAKVDAAIHARALINQSYDPATGEYNISQVPYGELSESMGALLSGQSGTSEGRIAALKQKTAQGDLNGTLTYFTGKPSNATSQAALKQLIDIIDRQGEVSEELRDNAFNKMKQLPTFKRLDEDSFNSLKDQHLGNSFKDTLKDAPDKQAKPTQEFEEGKTYVDGKGNKAKYVGGQWVEAK